MKNLLSYLLACLTLFVSSPSFGNDSDTKFAQLFDLKSPITWEKNDTFIYLDSKLNIALKPAIPQYRDTTNYLNQSFLFKGIGTTSDWSGNETITLAFEMNGTSYHFQTNKDLASYNDSTYNPLIAGLYPLKELRAAQDILLGKNFYLKTNEHVPLSTLKEKTKKFIPVTITQINTHTTDTPIEVIFEDQQGVEYSLTTRFSNTLQAQEKKNFLFHFSESDPRVKYPQTTDKVWQAIQQGNVLEGMTQSEVILSIGRSQEIERIPTYSGLRELWIYQNGAVVAFQDGLVSNYRK